ncbi:hypothetical protein TMEC54S_00349 [Thauera mechernichensis]|uniref:hypothetical protein n=1 Tax=Thauera sp. 27 TaxID=305700 RepID=UPI0002CE3075|nr:hypothetical protein [Thauera sp. 27]ENO79016.1 hypothetical protein B447_13604 [Thauera sp. 27]
MKINEAVGHQSEMVMATMAREQCIKSWVLERFKAKTEDEVTALLRTVRPSHAMIVQQAIRSTIEYQTIALGSRQYEVEFFTIPFVVASSGQLSRDQLNLEGIIPAITRAMKEHRLASNANGGATVLSHAIPHQRIRSLAFADMFAATREIFYSSVATPGARQQRIQAFRIGNDSPFMEMPSGDHFAGHLVGCSYRRVGAPASIARNPALFGLKLKTLLESHFATPSMDVTASVGSMAPIYTGIESCAVLQTDRFARALAHTYAGDEVCAEITADVSVVEPGITELSVRIKRASSLETIADLKVTFNLNEAGGIGDALARVAGIFDHDEQVMRHTTRYATMIN